MGAKIAAGAARGGKIGGAIGRMAFGAGAKGAGVVAGGAAGGLAAGAAAAALPAAAFLAAEEFVSSAWDRGESRGAMEDFLHGNSWRAVGGKGFNKQDRRKISKEIADEAIRDKDFGTDEMKWVK